MGNTKKNNNEVVFMAIGKVAESVEVKEYKKYIGVAPVRVLGVNPTKEQLEKIYDRELNAAPEYLTKAVSSDGNTEIDQLKLDFIVKTDVVKEGDIDLLTKVTFFLKNAIRYDRTNTKVQVINKYGETVYLTIDEAANGTIPKHLAWFEAADFRPAFVGEADLTGFIKAYLGIPNKSYRDKKTGEVVTLPNPDDAICRLDNIKEYFKGNIKELTTIAKLLPNNKVRVPFGVKTTDDNKQYQAVYTAVFMKNSNTSYNYLASQLKKDEDRGAHLNVEYYAGPLKEYNVEATNFSNESAPVATPAPAVDTTDWFKD